MVIKRNLMTFLSIVVLCTGCAASKIKPISVHPPTHKVMKIAVSPYSGVLGEEISKVLSKQKFDVVDTAETYHLFNRIGIKEVDEKSQSSITRLQNEGVDAYLVSMIAVGNTGQIKMAKITVYSTHTGGTLVSLLWENGWGGMPNSGADHMMKKDTQDAAQEIVAELTKCLRQQ